MHPHGQVTGKRVAWLRSCEQHFSRLYQHRPLGLYWPRETEPVEGHDSYGAWGSCKGTQGRIRLSCEWCEQLYYGSWFGCWWWIHCSIIYTSSQVWYFIVLLRTTWGPLSNECCASMDWKHILKYAGERTIEPLSTRRTTRSPWCVQRLTRECLLFYLSSRLVLWRAVSRSSELGT